jgi:hypothetical protein
MLATVITGIYMVLAAVGWVPWILVVIGALILAMMVARVLTMPRMIAIGHALASEKASVSQSLHNLINDSILWISVQTRVAIVLGILFLKIATPGLGGSLLTIGVAIVLGLVSAPMFRPVRVHEIARWSAHSGDENGRMIMKKLIKWTGIVWRLFVLIALGDVSNQHEKAQPDVSSIVVEMFIPSRGCRPREHIAIIWSCQMWWNLNGDHE